MAMAQDFSNSKLFGEIEGHFAMSATGKESNQGRCCAEAGLATLRAMALEAIATAAPS